MLTTLREGWKLLKTLGSEPWVCSHYSYQGLKKNLFKNNVFLNLFVGLFYCILSIAFCLFAFCLSVRLVDSVDRSLTSRSSCIFPLRFFWHVLSAFLYYCYLTSLYVIKSLSVCFRPPRDLDSKACVTIGEKVLLFLWLISWTHFWIGTYLLSSLHLS